MAHTSMRLNLAHGLAILAIAAAAGANTPPGFTLEATLVPSDAMNGQGFGFSLSASAGRVVVGASAGAAYVFRNEGDAWIEEARLTADDGEAGDGFGYSVAASGSSVVVGAISDTTPAGELAGSAYVYKWDGSNWLQEAKLTASDAGAFDFLGVTVAAENDLIAVGAFGHDLPAVANAGAVYVFQRGASGWVEQSKITAPNPTEGMGFGVRVALSKGRVLVGARGARSASGDITGAAYIYRRDTDEWVLDSVLASPTGEPLGEFGWYVDLWGDQAIVGAFNATTGAAPYAGTAFIFEGSEDQWSEAAELQPAVPRELGGFGSAVAIANDRAAVSAPGNTGIGPPYGVSIYQRVQGKWVHETTLFDPNGGASVGLGRSIDFMDRFVFVSTSYSNGAVLVFRTPPPPCYADVNGDSLVNGADLSFFLGVFGTTVADFPPSVYADFNGDGVIDASDLSVLLANFGLDCL